MTTIRLLILPCLLLASAARPAYAAAPAQTQVQETRCDYSARSVCEGAGCRSMSMDAGVYLLIPTLGRLMDSRIDAGIPGVLLPQARRCDQRGCTAFEVRPSLSGAFLNLSSPGWLMKIAVEDEPLVKLTHGQFTEVATQMLATYVSSGICR